MFFFLVCTRVNCNISEKANTQTKLKTFTQPRGGEAFFARHVSSHAWPIDIVYSVTFYSSTVDLHSIRAYRSAVICCSLMVTSVLKAEYRAQSYLSSVAKFTRDTTELEKEIKVNYVYTRIERNFVSCESNLILVRRRIYLEAHCFWSALSTSLSELSTTRGCSLSRKKLIRKSKYILHFQRTKSNSTKPKF